MGKEGKSLTIRILERTERTLSLPICHNISLFLLQKGGNLLMGFRQIEKKNPIKVFASHLSTPSLPGSLSLPLPAFFSVASRLCCLLLSTAHVFSSCSSTRRTLCLSYSPPPPFSFLLSPFSFSLVHLNFWPRGRSMWRARRRGRRCR